MIQTIQTKALEYFGGLDFDSAKGKLNFDSISEFTASVQTEHLVMAALSICACLAALSTAKAALKIGLFVIAAAIGFRLIA